jgi:Domain of unknown function (DUF2382)
MHKQHLVAVYPSRNEAEQAFRAARGSGIPSHNIRMNDAEMGRTALSVQLDGGASDAKIEALEEILGRYHPVGVRVDEEGSTTDGPAKKAGGPSTSAAPKKGEEEIIPLPREEPKVAARATDRVHHIRTYVVEEPFEREVSLSDERLVVERRAATASKEGGKISERDYEFHERHEEPIVEMETRTEEELVVRKEPTQHTERVRGTARRTQVKIEKESAPAPASMKGRS